MAPPPSTPVEHSTTVLVVGAGPAGLLAGLQLARHGTPCMVVERNLDTTRWPKMDVTNCRSMELLRRLGLCEGLRDIGVAQHFPFDVLFSTGLSEGGELIGKWDLPSADQYRQQIKSQNDGSQPREPWQRCSQAVFEAWLKPQIQAEPLIESIFGLKFESLVESDTGVESTLTGTVSGETHIIRSKYVIGCDGGGSRVRRQIWGTLIGGPTPQAAYLVHFQSRDLTRLHAQGQFWHIFLSNGSAIIAQNEIDTWTTHLFVPLDLDTSTLDPHAVVAQVLGGSAGPYPIAIDEILVTSTWRPNICLVDRYDSSTNGYGKVFLSGDAAHQNVPTGGYGMNTALGDSFDIGWKLAAVMNGWGGQHLLQSYQIERRPVAQRNIERSGVHMSVHGTWWEWCRDAGAATTTSQDEEGRKLKEKIRGLMTEQDGENKDVGIELGARYNGSPIVVPDDDQDRNGMEKAQEPPWNVRSYVPSTWPGARAPHVFLKDGETSIFDLFGPWFTFVDFSSNGSESGKFAAAAEKLGIPLKVVHLPDEAHVRKIWSRDGVLVRPDDHVAWRSPLGADAKVDVEEVLLVAVGRKMAPGFSDRVNDGSDLPTEASAEDKAFTATIGNVDQEHVAMMAEFQK